MSHKGGKREAVSLCMLPFALLLVGCSNLFDSSTGRVEPLDGNVLFRVHEGHPTYDYVGEPEIILSLETEKIYGCINYNIVSESRMNQDSILIRILGVYIGDICATATGPAKSDTVLDISKGVYALNYLYALWRDAYHLTVTDSSLVVSTDTARFTGPAYSLYWRYPPNSFVYLCGTTIETAWMCEDFLDSLRAGIELVEFQFPDSGQIPYPSSSGGHYYDMPAKYFTYETEGDFNRAGEILESYTHNVIGERPGIGLSLINWKNQSFRSWLF